MSTGAAQALVFLWSTGATTSSITIIGTGSSSYTLTTQDSNGCTLKDTIVVSVKGVAPIPGFISPDVCYGNVSLFTDTTKVQPPDNITLWSWDFGDGTPLSFSQNPSHIYASSGAYQVILDVPQGSKAHA